METGTNLSLQSDTFHLDGWVVIPRECRIYQKAEPKADAKITPKAMEVLLYLAERSGEVVATNDILDDIWGNQINGPNAVQKAIAEIRKALQDDARNPRLLQTVPKRGYKLLLQPYFADSVENKSMGRMSSTKWRLLATAAAGLIVAAFVYLLAPQLTLNETAAEQSCPAQEEGEPACPKTSPTSIAVLPFDAGDSEGINSQVYASSLSDLITSGLLKVEHLSVASHRDAQKFSLSDATTREVAEQLGVEHLLLGQVAITGDNVNVEVELVNGLTGVEMYRAGFNKPTNELYEFQGEIARQVLSSLGVHLDDVMREAMVDTGTTNAEAFLENKKAAFIVNNNMFEELPTAVRHARRALELDPQYEGAYRCMLVAFDNMSPYIGVENNEILRDQISAVIKDIETNLPNSDLLRLARFVEASVGNDQMRLVQSTVGRIKKDPASALEEFNPPPYPVLGVQLIYAGLLSEGDAYIRAFNAAHDQPHQQNLYLYYEQGGLEATIVRRKELIAENVQTITMLAGLVSELGKLGRFDEARKYLDQLTQLDEQGLWAHGTRHILMALRGELPFDSQAFDAFDQHPLTTNFTRGHIAFIQGNIDQGLAYWRRLSPAEKNLIGNSRVFLELLYKPEVLESSAYQDLKNDLGVGTEWQLYLASKVQELEPFTGIALKSVSPQLAGL